MTADLASFRKSDKDTGSPEIQCALFSLRIEALTQHLKEHPHDYQTRRGLIAVIVKRKRLLKYLMNVNYQRYEQLKQKLNLRK